MPRRGSGNRAPGIQGAEPPRMIAGTDHGPGVGLIVADDLDDTKAVRGDFRIYLVLGDFVEFPLCVAGEHYLMVSILEIDPQNAIIGDRTGLGQPMRQFRECQALGDLGKGRAACERGTYGTDRGHSGNDRKTLERLAPAIGRDDYVADGGRARTAGRNIVVVIRPK